MKSKKYPTASWYWLALVNEALAKEIKDCTGDTGLFFDAVAPLVSFESIDMENAYFASRYDKGSPDYINCPLNKEEYLSFHNELLNAEMAELRDFEDSAVFEGCMPIESLAKRGEDTMRFGPLKPVGLTNPKTEKQDYAVIQLRKTTVRKHIQHGGLSNSPQV